MNNEAIHSILRYEFLKYLKIKIRVKITEKNIHLMYILYTSILHKCIAVVQ